MLVTRRSTITHRDTTMDLDVTEAQLTRYFEGNELIQRVFSHLSADEREFIKTGITPQEWDELFA